MTTRQLRFPTWVSYVPDAHSGEYYEAAEENRPGEAPRPIVRDGIAKVYVS